MHKQEPFVLTGQIHNPDILQFIEDAGFRAVHIPLIETRRCRLSPEELKEIVSKDWLLFTSQTAVHAFFEQVDEPLDNRFAVVGSKTQKALESYGYKASFVPTRYSADTFVEEWNATYNDRERLAFLKGNLAKNTIEDGLDADVTSYIVYETAALPDNVEKLVALSQQVEQMTVLFASPSAVEAFVQPRLTLQCRVVYCAIGHITRNAMEKAGLPVHVMPETYTLEEVVRRRMTMKE